MRSSPAAQEVKPQISPATRNPPPRRPEIAAKLQTLSDTSGADVLVGALEAIHRRKLKIPGDIAVIGFDDLPWAEALDPPLTVVRQPAYEVGQAATELLLKRLEDPKRAETHLKLLPKLVIRNSC